MVGGGSIVTQVAVGVVDPLAYVGLRCPRLPGLFVVAVRGLPVP